MKSKSLRITLLLTLFFTLAFASVAQAAGPTATEAKKYQATIKDNINGNKVGMPKEAPLRLNVYQNGTLVDHFNMVNGDVVMKKWPTGEYNFVFVEGKTQKPLIQCGQYTISTPGEKVTITAVDKGSTPACVVKIRK